MHLTNKRGEKNLREEPINKDFPKLVEATQYALSENHVTAGKQVNKECCSLLKHIANL